MIEVKGLTKKYGDIIGIRDVTFNVEKGEVLGFLGPNGAGKTTTMRIITGYMPPTEGVAKVCGYDVTTEPIEIKKRTGYMPEHPPLYPDMTVSDYLNFVAKIKGIHTSEVKNAVDGVIVRCGLEEVTKRLIKNLSKGYRQRVGVAQAIIHNPDVLVLDEPTIGLDPQQVLDIRNLIKELGKEHTIILSTHILPEVTMVCNRVLIIHRGSLVADESLAELYKKERDRLILTLRVEGDREAVYKELRDIKGIGNVERRNGEFVLECEGGVDPREEIVKFIVNAGYKLLEMKEEFPSLEEVYIRKVSGE